MTGDLETNAMIDRLRKECEACCGSGRRLNATAGSGEYARDLVVDCPDCNGTGARADVEAIARRYGGDGDARSARFEVKR